MNTKVTVKDYMKAHCEQSMSRALEAQRYTTWEKKCPVLSDVDFVYSGLLRCFSLSDSGRHFLQTATEVFDNPLTHTNYFTNLNSMRRTNMLEAVEKQSYKLNCQKMEALGINYLKQFPELDDYTVEAADGHFIDHACHTQASPNGITYAAGFIYALDLRFGLLHPLCCVTNGSKRNHEIPAFRRKIEMMNDDSKADEKSLYVYDKAITDYNWWQSQTKHKNYMVSILKENANFSLGKEIEFDRNDEVNIGVQSYYHCKKGTSNFTIVVYHDPETHDVIKFISTLPSNVRPGTISNLYYKRWTIEKAFNNSKSNLKEKKAWSSKTRALNNQMRLIAMTYNLARVLEEISKKESPELIHPAEKKYTKALEKRQLKAEKVNKFVNPLLFKQRITRICSSTIRSIQSGIYAELSLISLMLNLKGQLVAKPG